MPASGTISKAGNKALLLLLLLAACVRPEPQQPEQIYRDFCQAVTAGEWERALGHLDADSRRALTLAAQRLARQARPEERDAVKLSRLLRARLPLPLQEVTTLSSTAGRVELQVRAGTCRSQQDCRQERVELVRQGGAWKIRAQLPPELALLLDSREVP